MTWREREVFRIRLGRSGLVPGACARAAGGWDQGGDQCPVCSLAGESSSPCAAHGARSQSFCFGRHWREPWESFPCERGGKARLRGDQGGCEHSLGCVHLSSYFPPLISPVSHGECCKCSFPSGVTTAPTEPAPSSCLSHCSQVWGWGGTKGALGSWG